MVYVKTKLINNNIIEYIRLREQGFKVLWAAENQIFLFKKLERRFK